MNDKPGIHYSMEVYKVQRIKAFSVNKMGENGWRVKQLYINCQEWW